MFKKLLIPFILLTPIAGHAEEASVNKWSGEAELGYLKTSGNTDTESLHAKGKLVNERKRWKHTATLEVTDKSDNGVTSASRWYLTGKSDYKIDDLSYLFGTVSYENDDFSGYDYQITEVVGYGYHAIKKEDLKLDLEAGVGARQSKLSSTGTSNSEGMITGAANLEWVISKTSTFTQLLSVEAGEDSTISRSVTALKMQIVGNLSAKLSHSIKHSSDVPVGTEKKDTESVITLVYNF